MSNTSKHLRQYLGDAFETARVGHAASEPMARHRRPGDKPDLLLAHSWDSTAVDPTGWFISEKLDGVRAFWNGKNFLSRLGNIFPAPDSFVSALPSGTLSCPTRTQFSASHSFELPKDITLDGELFTARGKFNNTVSIVKTSGSARWTSGWP